MPSIRIWTLESPNDAKAVRCLANKLVNHLCLSHISINTVEGQTFLKNQRIPGSLGDKLSKAVQNFVDQGEYIIFIIDSDSPMSLHQRRQETNSLINQINRILGDQKFSGKVFFTPAVQELEAWLLIDCLGIFCYFASKRSRYRENCRSKVSKKPPFIKFVNNRQKGDTENIVEPEIGGSGPKEYLIKFSREILLKLNPGMPPKNLDREEYSEKKSHEVAEHVVIDEKSLRRNNSLQKLSDVLKQLP